MENIIEVKDLWEVYSEKEGFFDVDDRDLIAALESGHLGGAGLDVVDPEPLPEDSPLWDMPNVLITSHTSGASPNYWERGAAILIENVRRFGAGEPLTNVVDLEAGY